MDLEAKEEAEAWAASIPEYDLRIMEAQMMGVEPGEDPDPTADCGMFCKYLRSGNGFPGEFVNSCSASGNEHIISVDFDISKVI